MELGQSPTFATDQVIVLRVSVIVFEDIAVLLPGHFADEARLFQLQQRPVDGRSADPASICFLSETANELLGVEVFVVSEYLFDNDASLARQTQSLGGEVFAILLGRRDGDADVGEGSLHDVEPV